MCLRVLQAWSWSGRSPSPRVQRSWKRLRDGLLVWSEVTAQAFTLVVASFVFRILVFFFFSGMCLSPYSVPCTMEGTGQEELPRPCPLRLKFHAFHHRSLGQTAETTLKDACPPAPSFGSPGWRTLAPQNLVATGYRADAPGGDHLLSILHPQCEHLPIQVLMLGLSESCWPSLAMHILASSLDEPSPEPQLLNPPGPSWLRLCWSVSSSRLS